jgi:hypothetical protein
MRWRFFKGYSGEVTVEGRVLPRLYLMNVRERYRRKVNEKRSAESRGRPPFFSRWIK